MSNAFRHCLRILAALLLWALSGSFALQPAVAQSIQNIAAPQQRLEPKPDYHFDPSDAIRGHLDATPPVIFVGEPFMIPLVLVNHMKYPITLRTSFNPRGDLSIVIQRDNRAPQNYYAHYQPGFYGPLELKLMPMQEVSNRVLIWSDADQPSGLAFPEPGNYTITVSIKLQVPEAKLTREDQFPPIRVQVVPTPAELAPLIDEIAQWPHAFVQLQSRHLPKGHEERVLELIRKYPASPLTPYLCYAASGELLTRYNLHPEDKTLSDRMLYYLQLATIPQTSFQVESLTSLLSVFDQLGLSRQAAATAQRLLKVMPRDLVGTIGNNSLVKKYLLNTTELDPEKYWSVLQ
jgi:hypothetical protein